LAESQTAIYHSKEHSLGYKTGQKTAFSDAPAQSYGQKSICENFEKSVFCTFDQFLLVEYKVFFFSFERELKMPSNGY
jgi:hypothetical protein